MRKCPRTVKGYFAAAGSLRDSGERGIGKQDSYGFNVQKRIPAGCERYASGYLYLALNIGEQMLMCGAEVHRVEDCIRRICTAYGAVRVDVFSITSSIVVTMYGPDFGSLTQTRRISRQNTDMYRLDRLNQLSVISAAWYRLSPRRRTS